MEQEIKKDWEMLKSIIQSFNQKNKNETYITNKEIENFEKIIRKTLRVKKFERILKQ